MLGDKRSHGLWEQTAIVAPRTTTLRGSLKTDVLIIGCGYTGLSAALHLAQSGTDTVALEAAEIGFGASGRNAGMVNAGLLHRPDAVVATLGADYGHRLLALLKNGPEAVCALIKRHGIECELETGGTLHCAHNELGRKEIELRAEEWSRHGRPMRLIGADETAQMTGSEIYRAALHDPAAATIQPLSYARGLARAALDAGGRIFTNSPVLQLRQESRRWLAATPAGRIEAKWVIIATDAYSHAIWPHVDKELIQVGYFNFATQPLAERVLEAIIPGRQGLWDTSRLMRSIRRDRAGRLIIGSLGSLDAVGRAIHRRWAHQTLRKVFPQLGAIAFESSWCGAVGLTGDWFPKLHRYAPTVVGVSGYSGRGIVPATLLGEDVARFVSGARSEKELHLPVTDPISPRFKRARELGFDVSAKIGHLAA